MKPIPTLACSIKQAVQASGISRSKIYELIDQGEIVPRKCGTRTLILFADLKQYIESLPASQNKGGSDD